MAQVNTFLKFNDGKCVEAMNFYKDILGGELEFNMVKDTPMNAGMPADMIAEKGNLVMHSVLKKGSWTLIASDMMRDKAVIGDNVGIFIECESDEEIKAAFAKLSEGGQVFMPLEDVFWGSTFGCVTDKYGIEWMLNFQKTPVSK